MGLIRLMKTFGFLVFSEEPIVHCKAFEYEYRAIDLSRPPKICLHTKHVNVVFIHSHEYVSKGLIQIHQVSTDDQYVDTWTKMFPYNVLLKHINMILGL